MNFSVLCLEDEIRLSKAEPVAKGIIRSMSCFTIAYPTTNLQELATETAGNWADQAQR